MQWREKSINLAKDRLVFHSIFAKSINFLFSLCKSIIGRKTRGGKCVRMRGVTSGLRENGSLPAYAKLGHLIKSFDRICQNSWKVMRNKVLFYCMWHFFLELKKLEQTYTETEIPNEEQIGSYYKIRLQLNNLAKELQSYIQKPQYLLPYLQPGRLLKVCSSFVTDLLYNTSYWPSFLPLFPIYAGKWKKPLLLGWKWWWWFWMGCYCEFPEESQTAKGRSLMLKCTDNVRNRELDWHSDIQANQFMCCMYFQAPGDSTIQYVAEVLLHLTKETARASKTSQVKPCPAGEKGEMQVWLCKIFCIVVLKNHFIYD